VIARSIRFWMALWYAALLAGALALFGPASYPWIGSILYCQGFRLNIACERYRQA